MKLIKETPFTQIELKEYLHYNKCTGIFTKKSNNIIYVKPKSHKELYIQFKYKSTKASYLAFYYMTGKIPNSIYKINGDLNDNSFDNLKDISHLTCNPDLTHDLLLEVLDYNLDTGIFNWIIKLNKTELKYCETTSKGGYKCIRLFDKLYSSHRLAWFYINKSWPKEQIDHIDHNPSNNKINNLRDVDNAENNKNISLQSNNKTGYHGVRRYENGYYGAGIKVNGKGIYLGYFKNKDDAIKARKEAEIKYNFHKNHGKTKYNV